MKRCKRCGATKSLSEFYRPRKYFDCYCIECRKEYSRNAPGRFATQRRRWGKSSVRQYHRELIAKIREERPQEHKARVAVGAAVKAGKLVKGVCQECGSSEEVQAHHDDYSKPLVVRWLCRKHHIELHWGVKLSGK